MQMIRVDRSTFDEMFSLGVSVVLCFFAAALGSAAVMQTIGTWYLSLTKPGWNPPNWIFGPVWTTLYLLMAVSAWLVWRQRRNQPAKVRIALWLFVIQLSLNAAWSWIFFAWMRPGEAFVEILFLWLAIIATMISEWPVSRLASFLLVPYLAWVSFATVLNGVIWRLN